jgi:hypothetical protein
MLSSFLVPTRISVACAGSLGVLLLTGCAGSTGFVPTVAPQQPPAPHLDAISPGIVPAGGADPVTVTLIGGNFDNNTQVLAYNGASISGLLTATYVGSTELQVTIPAYYVAFPAILSIRVFEGSDTANPANSGAVPLFAVTDKPITDESRVPALSSVLPTSLAVGRIGSEIIVTGTNFTTTSTIEVNGTARETVVAASNTVITAMGVLASDVATTGNLQIVVIDDPNIAPSVPISLPVVPQ